MKIAEVPMNILTVPQGWYLAYAVSTDMDFSIGLPKLMNDTFAVAEKIEQSYNVGEAALTDSVFSLFVKDSSYDCVDINDLYRTIEAMCDMCIEKHITKIAIPKLCCGRNALKWKEVKKIIKAIFKPYNIFVMVCV